MTIKSIQNQVSTVIRDLENHELHKLIDSTESVSSFMQYHVFAVWDFMNLLKSLQGIIAPTSVPWIPKNVPVPIVRLINEVVLDEESDMFYSSKDDSNEEITISHFELYKSAMRECDASLVQINRLISHLENGCGFDTAIELSVLPASVEEFLKSNNALLVVDKPHVIASAFCFGREVSLPKIFANMLEFQLQNTEETRTFVTYLQRHLQMDSESHSNKAKELLAYFCGNNPLKWAEATAAADLALRARLKFWDAISDHLKYQNSSMLN